ncbi:ABC transporter ATP-binding protein [Beggiatoa leptomitoformis]|uniref:ATP-binding cassette domain-containing protein n=1 Tax=Beggiatoa leptomitoformis TaxID=288004 RepID=A0A2N9YGD6_9GAMM|nr:ABC transporter ATP-binding protein [Beggiatoa leptomitoformis]ALG68115.1 ATP-binding cassette domain-containing protein [Beggiatoa leptomitoformis]AUI69588.1 ATP-binding cassette domain-containing protein [Beggiatoa leptomitoformis]
MQVIRLENVNKTYSYYAHGVDRLLEILTKRRHHEEFVALHPLNLTIEHGQVIGVIGNNGAGKSTLLKIIAGTLSPDKGTSHVLGRVSALLELGGGFHPDMTGRENVYLNGTMMGLTIPEIDKLYHAIVEFAGIQEFMDHPVKTYSSGMFVRLAFAVATCTEPDILIVDEALSVGDGGFARKSFNRIMQFKQAGKTILFCSHSMYQIEAICDRVIWLEQGQIKMDGVPSSVVSAYTESLSQNVNAQLNTATTPVENATTSTFVEGTAKIKEVSVMADGVTEKKLDIFSLHSELCVTVKFTSDISLASPTVGVLVINADGRFITSAGTQHDGLQIQRDAKGNATVRVTFPKLALLKGEYWIDVFLLCENAIHVYDHASAVATLNVRQQGLEQGVVSLPRQWAQI